MTDDRPTPRPRMSRRLIGTTVAVLVLVGGGWVTWHFWGRPTDRAERLLARARSLRSAGDDPRAERMAATALELDPTLGEAALLAAECAAGGDEFQRAVDYLQQVTSADPRIRLRAALFAAELNHHRLHRLSQAERAYHTALDLDPDNIDANAGLANLLGLCGRTREAVRYVLRLVRLGKPTELLVLVSRENGVVNDPDALELAHRAAPDDANPLVGLAWHAAESERTDEAIELLREAIRLQPDHVAAHVALGRQLHAARRFDELVRWAERIPPAADEFAETWVVRGQMAENDGHVKAAIRCYWEAVRRAPESKTANFRLARLLANAHGLQPVGFSGATDASESFAQHIRRLQELDAMQNRVFFSSDHRGIEPLLELAKSYEVAGRLWEAYGWCQLAVQIDASREDARRYLAGLGRKVEGIPLRLTVDSANVALAVDLSMYPLPRFREAPVSPTAVGSDTSTKMSFRDDASSAGLRFRYFNGTGGRPSRRMFEQNGGGVAVLDFDGDGWPDLYFTQGAEWKHGSTEPTLSGETTDRVYRDVGGRSFVDVTRETRLVGRGFGQGVAVGDFDADGFPDLYVANIGANHLWMNNGDGTFTDVTREAGVAGDEWTTSCVLADLDGDGLSDIYAVNYLTAQDVFERVCTHADGAPIACSPFHFDGEPDRLWLNDGNGRFTDATADVLSVEPSGKGLGVAVWDALGTGRLSLLVTNDTTPNFFFVNGAAGDRRPRLRERGIAAGLALNEDGKAEGCMGIGLGDVDDDGRLDVHVTNFLSESNTLYVNPSAGVYEDRTRVMGLHSPTIDVLGFGTQFLDVDLDGRLEVFVSNGHVDDLRRYGRPYEMPPQLFRWNQRRFVEVDATELGSYFRRQWLGRSVARLDWNRDGRNDLVVGHLADEAALLTNTTRDAGRFLSLRLFGVQSNRDAIGTTVRACVGERTIVRQLTAGDGYQASNERRLVFGLGNAEQIDELVVRWPSGTIQHFDNVPTSQEVWLPEGRSLVVAPAVSERVPSANTIRPAMR